MNKKVIAVVGLLVAAVAAVSVCVWLSSAEAEANQEAKPPKRAVASKKAVPSKGVRPAVVRPVKGPKVAGTVKDGKPKGDGKEDVLQGAVSGVGEGNTVVVKNPEGVKRSSAIDIDPAIMKELRDVFSKSATGKLAGADLVKSLAGYTPSVVLGAAGSVMKDGSATEKANALYAVGLLFGKESRTGVPFEAAHPEMIVVGEDGEATSSSGLAEANVALGRQLVDTVSAGLSDEDASVRDTAFDVMRTLPDEEGGVLAADLLSNGDAGLQERLMREAGEDGAGGVRYSLMGMGSENEAVRALAAQNLKSLSGRAFASQQEAAEWYEAHQSEFSQKVETESSASGTGENQPTENQNETRK